MYDGKGKDKDKETEVSMEYCIRLLKQNDAFSLGELTELIVNDALTLDNITSLLPEALINGNNNAAKLLARSGAKITKDCMEKLVEANCLEGIKLIASLKANWHDAGCFLDNTAVIRGQTYHPRTAEQYIAGITNWALPLAVIKENEAIAGYLLEIDNSREYSKFTQTLSWATSWYNNLCIKVIKDENRLAILLDHYVSKNDEFGVIQLLRNKIKPSYKNINTATRKGYSNLIWPLALYGYGDIDGLQQEDIKEAKRLAGLLSHRKDAGYALEKFEKVEDLIGKSSQEKIDMTTPIGYVKALLSAYKHLPPSTANQKPYAKQILADIDAGLVSDENLKTYIAAHKAKFNQEAVKKNPTSGYEALLEYILSEYFDARFPETLPLKPLEPPKELQYSNKEESLRYRIRLINQFDIAGDLLPEGKDYKKLYELLFNVINGCSSVLIPHIEIKESWQIEALLDDDLSHWIESDFSKKDNWGSGPGLYFIWSGNIEKVKMYSIPREKKERFGLDRFFYAGCSNNIEMLKWVLEKDKEVIDLKSEVTAYSLSKLVLARKHMALAIFAKYHPEYKFSAFRHSRSLGYLAACSGCPETLNIALSMQINPGFLSYSEYLHLDPWSPNFTNITSAMHKALDSNLTLIGFRGEHATDAERFIKPATKEKLLRNKSNPVSTAKILIWTEMERLMSKQKETLVMGSSLKRVMALDKLISFVDDYDEHNKSKSEIAIGGWFEANETCLTKELNKAKTAITSGIFTSNTETRTITCLKKVLAVLDLKVDLRKEKLEEAVTITTTGTPFDHL